MVKFQRSPEGKILKPDGFVPVDLSDLFNSYFRNLNNKTKYTNYAKLMIMGI
jgi:hypothetical protein